MKKLLLKIFGSVYDRMRHGIGVFSSGVSDLGTNPRHLHGLGE